MFAQNALANSLMRQSGFSDSLPLDMVWASDGIDTRYRFSAYRINAHPDGINAVYIFAQLFGSTYIPLYIGQAENLRERLERHEKRIVAIVLGATHLLVHIPAKQDRIGFREVERRLIGRFSPVLNVQHNRISAV